MRNKHFLPAFCLVLAASLIGAGCELPAAEDGGAVTQTETATSTETVTAKPTVIELYTSETCPHCHNVKNQIMANGWDKLMPIGQKPLEDQANLKLVTERAKTCRLALDKLQVPMLWNGQRCLTGDGPILGYLTQLSKLYETSTSTSR